MSSKPTRLDPRSSRKLTSRECSSIIGGFLGGMATSNLVGVEVARAALGLWVEGETADNAWDAIRAQETGGNKVAGKIEEAREWQADGGDEAHRVFWRGLGAVIAGCRVVAYERSVRTAVCWLYEKDDFWKMVGS